MSDTVTVIINNCNLLTWPRAMIRRIESFEALARIVIVDNGSTYPPLLDYYRLVGHEVIRLPNVGHQAPWSGEVVGRIATPYYVVTDPDLGLEDTPADCLLHLIACLRRFPEAGKIGLGLRIDDVPPASPYFQHVNSYERRLWDLPLIDGLVRAAPVDTTFALYHKSLLDHYAITGGRTAMPYAARHLPWSVVTPDAEFAYYLERASSSCSYKGFVQRGGQITAGAITAGCGLRPSDPSSS